MQNYSTYIGKKVVAKTVLTLAVLGGLGGLACAQAAGVPQSVRAALKDRVNFSALTPNTEYTRFIVHYRDAVPSSKQAPAAHVAMLLNRLDADMQRVGASLGAQINYVRSLATGGQVIDVASKGKSVGVARTIDAASLMTEFASNPDIAYIEPDSTARIAVTPNDEFYSKQWDLYEDKAGMNVPSAWDITSGTGTTVAVLDTGLAAHRDLWATIAGYDFISQSGTAGDGDGRDSNPSDDGDWFENWACGLFAGRSGNSSWHGTHVSGTILATSNNGFGVAGIANEARLVPVRVLGRCGGNLSDIADAIVWASGGRVDGAPDNANPARVINLSLGAQEACGETYQKAIDLARSRGTVVVAAAGNSNANVSGFSPASCSGVIAVAASDRGGDRAYYSNYGDLIDVTAPGGELYQNDDSNGILSTLNSGTREQQDPSYKYYQGTSMAAPHVAALAALVFTKNPILTPDQVETLIKDNTRSLPGTCSGGCGKGLVDAAKTLQAVPEVKNKLGNGAVVNALSANQGVELDYAMAVPFGVKDLKITLEGGSGDADLYVRFGLPPMPNSQQDCKSAGGNNNESCNFGLPSAGIYYIKLLAYRGFSDVKLKASFSPKTSATFSNATRYRIPDGQDMISSIAVSGLSNGTFVDKFTVKTNITHPIRAGTKLQLVFNGDDKTQFAVVLKPFDHKDDKDQSNVNETFNVSLGERFKLKANGLWTLDVIDRSDGKVGSIDSWSLEF
ncbi:MAG: S8 family serine peptidase [Rhodanobacteraceae bacterium]|nr:S8 family serine peptidase [Rhodanobacteraceae bacterium]